MGLNDINSLSHSKWNCKYHIVFAPKYRRMVFYGEKKVAVGKILRQLCEWKGVNIIEAELCPDHVHILVEIPPKMAVSSFMDYVMSKNMGHEGVLSASTVMLTTLFSAFTLTGWLFVLRSFGLV